MTIRASHASDIRTLIESLGAETDVDRDVAVARLAIIGVRAVDRLVAAYPGAGPRARVGILRALEAIADPRTVAVARLALEEGGDIAVAATGSLRALLDSPSERAATAALDALVGTALDPSAERRVRLMAFDALREMPPAIRDPIADALRHDGEALAVDSADAPTQATWQDAIDGRLPDDPAAVLEAVEANAATAPLGTLQKLVDAVRSREPEAPSRSEREGWRHVRGAIHRALALRGSRIALYDLRETLAAAGEPLPVTFITALRAAGDESCLEPIAAAWTAAGAEGTWRQQLAAAFATIVKREKLTRRHATLKRIAARWPGIT